MALVRCVWAAKEHFLSVLHQGEDLEDWADYSEQAALEVGSPTFILVFSACRGRGERLWESGWRPASWVPGYRGFGQGLQPGKDNCSNKTKHVNTCGDVLKQIQISFHRSLLRPTCFRERKKTRKARWVFFKMPSCSWAQSKISMITGIDYFQARAQIGLVQIFKVLSIPFK